MSRQRASVGMTTGEIDNFLAATTTLIVGSHKADGTIHLAPMWFALVEHSIVMWTYSKSQKVVNLRQDNRATVLAEDGEQYGELRGVQLVGRLELVDDPMAVARIGAAIISRNLGVAVDETAGAAQAAKRIGLRLTADQTVSWDYRKLAGQH